LARTQADLRDFCQRAVIVTNDDDLVESVLESALIRLRARGASLDEHGKGVVRGWAAANRGKIVAKQRDGWDDKKFADKLFEILNDARRRQSAGEDAAEPAAREMTFARQAEVSSVIRGAHVQNAFDECPNC
jgi:hypothetical protein